jgi:hypothetical protein
MTTPISLTEQQLEQKIINSATGNPSDILLFICPHCQGEIEVQRSETNCQIFRHGQYRINGQQVNPHLPKAECDQLSEQELIWGCGKPFQISIEDDQWSVHTCDYI